MTDPGPVLCKHLAEWKKNYPDAKMIGVETLPAKKKGEHWVFDESGRSDTPACCSSPLTSRCPQSTSPIPITTSGLRPM